MCASLDGLAGSARIERDKGPVERVVSRRSIYRQAAVRFRLARCEPG